jgi:hypothetical protein
MQLTPQHGSTVGYLALVVLLFAGIGIGVMLFALQMRGPTGHAEFFVAPPSTEECPTASAASECYRYDVTNVGDGASEMRCVVSPVGDATTRFTSSGTSTYDSPRLVEPDETYAMFVEVETPEGSKEPKGAPTLGCGPPA